MEFKEKLQLLRTNLKLSQEELANRLGISRQSITKWENGQSFPDIQKLIQLSEIFKVSVDRLVKENDICTISLFCEQKYPMQDIRIFLVRAKNNTYIAGENEIMPSRPGSHVSVSMPFRGPEFYQKGDYIYQCQVQGDFECFSGEERIYGLKI